MTVITHTNIMKTKSKDNLDFVNRIPTVKSRSELKKILNESSKALFYVTEDKLYPCTILKYKKHNIIFSEPNPVSFYYSLAKGAALDIKKYRKLLDQFYSDKTKLPIGFQNDIIIFSYIFKVGSVGIIFSFSAIEALLNQLIPDDYTTIKKIKKLTKAEIQRYFSFEEKITSIIPNITNKKFIDKYPQKYDLIKKLKKRRDELIHLKNNKEENITYYTKIYQDVLEINLTELVQATKDICNYYQKKTIIA